MNTMNEFEHKEFIESNSIREDDLPVALKKKIDIFNRVAAKLNDTIDDDYEELIKRLTRLDKEIASDLEDEYEDLLENNEFLVTNEDILEQLLQQKRQVIGSLELKKLGYKGELSADIIPLKNYCLQRASVFSYKYKIHKKN